MGTLKAKVNGVWVAINGGSGSDEVFVQPDDPITANPTAELWYDTDAPAPTRELLYSPMTANVNVTATSIATAQNLINPGNVTYDGAPIWVEAYFPGITQPNVANGQLVVNLFDANTDLGYMGAVYAPAATGLQVPMFGRRRITPTPGAHNYNLRAWVNPSGSGYVVGGGVYNYGYIRVERV